jgi:hypothetical protein
MANKTETIIEVGDAKLELRLTMRRVELLEEHAGIDLLNAKGDEIGATLRTARGITGALYALAGGESEVGMTREAFADTVSLTDLAPLARKIEAVFARDAGTGDSGNAESAEERESE